MLDSDKTHIVTLSNLVIFHNHSHSFRKTGQASKTISLFYLNDYSISAHLQR